MKVIPKRTFLAGQKQLDGGKTEDIIAHKGRQIEMSEKDACKYWGALALTDEQKKKLLIAAKNAGYNRMV